jgi:hypothetical protein
MHDFVVQSMLLKCHPTYLTMSGAYYYMLYWSYIYEEYRHLQHTWLVTGFKTCS